MTLFEKIFYVKNAPNKIRVKVANILGKKFEIPLGIPKKWHGREITLGENINDLIISKIESNLPFMLVRGGNSELSAFYYYMQHMKDKEIEFPIEIFNMMKYNAGFFSATHKDIASYSQKMLEILPNIDILDIIWWRRHEALMLKNSPNAKVLNNVFLNEHVLNSNNSWTSHLKGKKVLVIHPFEKTIISQYNKRKLLFKNSFFLPEFELKTIKAIQGIGGGKGTGFNSWWEALESMYKKIEETDFDIAIIGAGAFGLFLSNKVKECGKQAIQLCGATQILFGISGSRWDNDFGKKYYNEHWTRPFKEDTITNLEDFLTAEGSAAYW